MMHPADQLLIKPATLARRAETTRMFREAAEAPHVVAVQFAANRERMRQLGSRLRKLQPRAVVTCARGSSDHAATFARYLVEVCAGVLASSAAPSVSSVYATRPQLSGVVFLAISQSGRSPDLLVSVETAKAANATIVALVNDEASPLAGLADFVLPLCAGTEAGVAATKSYIASLAAIVHFVQCWTEDDELLDALERAPQNLTLAWNLDWSGAVSRVQSARDLYVIGRGFGLGAAQEAALKLKETCALHAEAFSAAEVRHGPMALVCADFPVLMFAQSDETRAGVVELAEQLARCGAGVMLAGARAAGALELPALKAHPIVEPLLLMQSFYRMAPMLSIARGLDPDHPPNLRKVTETL